MTNIMELWNSMGSWFNIVMLIIEIAVVFTMVVLAEKLFKKDGLVAWIAIATIMANIITNKSAEFFGWSSACGTVVFASVFLATDILSEKYTKEDAKRAIHIALASNIALIFITQILIHYMPSSTDFAHDAMAILFSGSLRISLASALMFYIANILDVYLFNKLKERMKGKYMWIRNNISTVICNCVENFCFMFLAFIYIPFLPGSFAGFPENTLNVVLILAATTTLIEILVAVCDTPFLYWATGNFKVLKNNPLSEDFKNKH
jgi:uncharacterized integral membrane protein (TIGR00697 family)